MHISKVQTGMYLYFEIELASLDLSYLIYNYNNFLTQIKLIFWQKKPQVFWLSYSLTLSGPVPERRKKANLDFYLHISFEP